ncbi:NAD(P)H-binding protein [Kibdelosporangium persicum]|uniref:Quinone oxidoreductase 2 n=1 Tax=Kibdelosporangium persicum TaxID=2698649 RepID=A0ABX2FH92_9PSEU|nr:Quinone oxidoreductase 2 [Kibdelosporangium persicum]
MIVITAPTSRIGKQVLDSAVDRGKPVRVIARDPSRISPQVRERVEIVHGSHSDPDVLTEAFAGADQVFWLVPPDFHAEDVAEHYVKFTRAACDAIQRQGVEHVVGVSSLGRAYGKHAGLLSAAYTMDELIESTGVCYRALRMPYFMENFLSQGEAIMSNGMFFVANAPDRVLATVATRDIATTAAALLLDDSWTGQDSVPVIGPDSLCPHEMARIMSEVLGREVHCHHVPLEKFRGTMTQRGVSEAWAQGMADMIAAQNGGIYDAEQQASPSAPTSFRQWCRHVLKPFLQA